MMNVLIVLMNMKKLIDQMELNLLGIIFGINVKGKWLD